MLARRILSQIGELVNAKQTEDIIAANALLKLHAAQIFAISQDRHLLDNIILHANRLASSTARIEAERSPGVAIVTAVLLIWLAVFGVVCPLANLSAQTVSSKQLFLALFSLGIAGLPLLIVYEIVKLRELGEYNIHLPPRPAAV